MFMRACLFISLLSGCAEAAGDDVAPSTRLLRPGEKRGTVPYTSRHEFRLLAALEDADDGKISQEEFEEWTWGCGGEAVPPPPPRRQQNKNWPRIEDWLQRR